MSDPSDDKEKDWRDSLPFPAHWLIYHRREAGRAGVGRGLRAALVRIAVMAAKIALRPALPADAPVLAALFRASIEELAQEDYSEAQLEAWAALADDEAAFAQKLAAR